AVAVRGWTPVGEFAQAELRVRDFWAHPPSLGAVGRLRTPTDVSSHPGPASWYAMYPFYAVLGRSAVALAASVAATAWCWAATAVALAWRRGGDAFAVMLGIGVLGLFAGLGPISFVEPWNPWFAVVPLLTVTIATWAVLDGSRWALVVVVVGATYCVQAHFGFLPIVGLLGVVALVGWWWNWRRCEGSSRSLVPLGVALGVGILLWVPPVLQQLTGDPGNMRVIFDAYRQEAGREAKLGIGGALSLLAAYVHPLSPARLLDQRLATAQSADGGSLVVFLAWVGAVVTAWKGRADRQTARAGLLVAVASIGLAGSVVAASQIPGEVFGYLVLWLVVLVVVLLVSIVWVGWVWVTRPHEGGEGALRAPLRPVARNGAVLGVAAIVFASVWTTVEFARTDVPATQLSEVAGELADSVGAQLGDPSDAQRWLVRWEDPLAFGALGTGLLSELERQGFDVGVDDHLRVEMRPHRVLPESDADGVLVVVTGEGIGAWEERAEEPGSGVRELVRVDPRDASTLDASEQLRESVQADLEALGGPDLAEQLDENYWVARSDPRVGAQLRDRIDELSPMGLPTAVFLVPVDSGVS
ncbi:MAG: hypothetical protein ACK5O2_03970, partial [Microthrixaceae bacterium]